MPWGNRTGPLGMGPRTGRAGGYCAGFGMPGYANSIPGRGFGFGRARGRGWRCGFDPGFGFGRGFKGWGAPYAYYGEIPYGAQPGMSPEQEKQILQNEAENLKDALSNLEKRIKELEKQD